MSAPEPSTPLDAVLVTLGRMEVKLDRALTTNDDHEARIRALESRSTVSPRTLWATVSGGAGLALAAGPVIARLFPQ